EDFPVKLPGVGGLTDLCGSGNLAGVSSFGFGGANAHVVLERGSAPVEAGTSMAGKKIAFLFAGQGTQYVGMGRELYAGEMVFKGAIDRCAALLDERLGCSLVSMLFDQHVGTPRIDETQYCQPCLFAFEYALAELWKSYGVVPDAVMGHSAGEVVAACVAGVMSLEDGLDFMVSRAKAMQAAPSNGGCMYAVRASEKDVTAAMGSDMNVSVAAVNGPKNVTVSGAEVDVLRLLDILSPAHSYRLEVSHAFHSPLMQPAHADVLAAASQVSFRTPSIPLVTNMTGCRVDDDMVTSAEHWAGLVMQPVEFMKGMHYLAKLGCTHFIEIGPSAALIGAGKSCSGIGETHTFVSSMKQGDKSSSHFNAVASKILNGSRSLFPNQQRFGWCEPSYVMAQQFDDSEDVDGALVQVASCTFGPRLRGLFSHHTVHGKAFVPEAGLIEAAAVAVSSQCDNDVTGAHLRSVRFVEPLLLGSDSCGLRTIVGDHCGKFEIRSSSSGNLVCFGSCSEMPALPLGTCIDEIRERCQGAVDIHKFCIGLEAAGFDGRLSVRLALSAFVGDGEALVSFRDGGDGGSQDWEESGFLVHPAILDGALQSVGLLLGQSSGSNQVASITYADSITVWQPCRSAIVWAHVVVVRKSSSSLKANITLLDGSCGKVIVEMKGCCFMLGLPQSLRPGPEARLPLFQVDWEQMEPVMTCSCEEREESWLVLNQTDLPMPDSKLAGVSMSWRVLEHDASTGLLKEWLEEQDWDKLVFLYSRTAPVSVGIQYLLSLTKSLEQMSDCQPPAYMITQDMFQAPGNAAESMPAYAWRHSWSVGFMRSARVEHPRLELHHVDCCSSGGDASLLDCLYALGGCNKQEPEVAYRGGSWYVPRLGPCDVDPDVNLRVRVEEQATYVISGGLGALGMLAARHLVELGATNVLLLSRSGLPKPDMVEAWDELHQASSGVKPVACDVCNKSQVEELRELLLDLPPVRGVLHAAGEMEPCLIVDSTVQSIEQALRAKVEGGWNLHCLGVSENWSLDFFVAYSSLASVLGERQGSGYAASNTALDGLVRYRQSLGLPAVAIQWGPWVGLGMAAGSSSALRSSSMHGVTAEVGLSVLGPIASSPLDAVVVADVDWSDYSDLFASYGRFLRNVAVSHKIAIGSSHIGREVLGMSEKQRRHHIEDVVHEVAKVTVGGADLSVDQPLMEAGLDSLALLEFRSRLQERLGLSGADLPGSLFFDHPTVERLSAHLDSELFQTEVSGACPVGLRSLRGRRSSSVAVVGMACRFPGGCATPQAYWDLLAAGGNGVTEIPHSRWDVDAHYDAELGARGKSYARHGGFIENAEMFAHTLFGVSVAEAAAMDPQQRVMLEVGYEALQRATYSKERLSGSNTGVFIGCCSSEWTSQQKDIGPFTGSGNADSLLANRTSYLLNLAGPSESIDTACSSSLVAVHHACCSLRRGECNVALVGGVSLLMSPAAQVARCQARMLSPDGRCKVFDASADGYVPGEGCGAVVLKCLEDAERDGDNILGVIVGSATGHNGRSASLTAPSGSAQQVVIRNALDEAGIPASEVSYIEAHGTGTALGDPIECRALKATFSEGRGIDSPLVVGAVKSNIGHLEGAAGMAGLIKTIMVLHHEASPGNLHLTKLNPEISLDGFPVIFPTPGDLTPLEGSGMYAGVSSFGFGGTNAHVAL
ncbi:unnamed protein product, partial [Chrysoparadoxa australica]